MERAEEGREEEKNIVEEKKEVEGVWENGRRRRTEGDGGKEEGWEYRGGIMGRRRKWMGRRKKKWRRNGSIGRGPGGRRRDE